MIYSKMSCDQRAEAPYNDKLVSGGVNLQSNETNVACLELRDLKTIDGGVFHLYTEINTKFKLHLTCHISRKV